MISTILIISHKGASSPIIRLSEDAPLLAVLSLGCADEIADASDSAASVDAIDSVDSACLANALGLLEFPWGFAFASYQLIRHFFHCCNWSRWSRSQDLMTFDACLIEITTSS